MRISKKDAADFSTASLQTNSKLIYCGLVLTLLMIHYH